MTVRPRKRLGFRISSAEQLEVRDMLAGHGFADFGHMAHNFMASAAVGQVSSYVASAATAGTQSMVHSQIFGALGSLASASSSTVLVATLTDANSNATGTIKYVTGTYDGVSETELKVSVNGSTVSSTLNVSIGTVVVGTLTTDSTGAGTLVLSSNPSGTEQSLPSNFPSSVTAGTAVSVGTLTGTLATSTSSTSDGGCELHQTGLTAALTDANSSATGTVTYQTSTKLGTSTTTFSISVSGAKASSSLDVAVDGTVIGQLTTDSTGAGTLVFSSSPTGTQVSLPSNFPTSITAGSTVTVGTLSGTFATSSSSSLSSNVARFGRHR